MMDELDDFLRTLQNRDLVTTKRLLHNLKRVYKAIGSPLMTQPFRDQTTIEKGWTFNYGCSDAELRRVASFLFTKGESFPKILNKLHIKLWVRGGREDKILAAIILANSKRDDDDVWVEGKNLIGELEEMETLAFLAEELVRSRENIVVSSILSDMSAYNNAQIEFVIHVVHSAFVQKNVVIDLKLDCSLRNISEVSRRAYQRVLHASSKVEENE